MPISTTPTITSRIVLEMKYGKIIKATPQTNGTTIFCLLPYTKKPRPIEPNSSPQRREYVSNCVLRAPNYIYTTKVSDNSPDHSCKRLICLSYRAAPYHVLNRRARRYFAPSARARAPSRQKTQRLRLRRTSHSY